MTILSDNPSNRHVQVGPFYRIRQAPLARACGEIAHEKIPAACQQREGTVSKI
jgi:hypothetical protein